ncbi:SufD family Fe-S cluster assembly protein [Nitratiruptor sp. YY09-18]|uniref:SufD family Fe-S cluster assembly protein n=1 Tax=Nitratiruptor sp. YY09-18 TaxID=2724901 RepID=UPI001915E7BA|nr:SufD family Fe-S cluster assembly protein [Nitratiruptor sp. YY09-18]BCD68219.1 Fe-S cluster assembly protein SufD [Nitratiruptor sp. YY09-18]
MKVLDINLEQFSEKKALIQKLKSMGLPTPKTEHYRYFGIRPLLEKDYTRYTPKPLRAEEGDVVEIVDGVLTKAPKDIYVHIQKNIKVDDSHYDQVYYISHLLSEHVINIEIESDTDLKIVQKFTKDGCFVPYRVKLTIAPNTQVNIEEEIVAIAQDALYFYGYDIEIAQDARVKLVQKRNTNIENFSTIGSHSIICQRNAAFDLFTFDFGNAKTLHNYHVVLEEHASTDQNHVIFARQQAKLGNTFHIENRGKESKTTQLSRNILKDHARGIFDGLLIVKNPAKYSSIYQDSKTILLNDGAYMVSKPQMEIYTEYILEATHGSTTGHLDEEALFYLRQRGIEKSLAKEMLVLSFLNEVFEKLGSEEIKEEFVKLYEEAQ